MKNSQRTSTRQYNKSELPRLRWTPELHEHFVEAVQSLGGKDTKGAKEFFAMQIKSKETGFAEASPKRILQQMRVKGLRIAQIKSHLQMYRNMKGHAILPPVDQLLEGNANDLKIRSLCSTERSMGTTLRVSKYENRIIKRELHLLDNKKGLSQTSEQTDYDLNQEPESSARLLSEDVSNEEDNCRIIEFPGLSFSFSTPIISMMKSDSVQEIMRFSSSVAASNHSVDSSSIPSGNNYVNLDLTI